MQYAALASKVTMTSEVEHDILMGPDGAWGHGAAAGAAAGQLPADGSAAAEAVAAAEAAAAAARAALSSAQVCGHLPASGWAQNAVAACLSAWWPQQVPGAAFCAQVHACRPLTLPCPAQTPSCPSLLRPANHSLPRPESLDSTYVYMIHVNQPWICPCLL
jgi:hypothetical protein